MTYSFWTDLCKQPVLKASSQQYAELVYESTIQLHQSLEPIWSALDRRAIGLTKCANFASALRDARVMQHLSPSSALGYIREADIYSEQGRQCQVIRVCNKGLRSVDPMDTHYDDLKRAKIDAEERQDTRIDFISELPLDIVTTTLIPMIADGRPLHSFNQPPYLDVSNVWRHRIIECLGGLHYQTGDDDEDELSDITKFARHVTLLEVVGYSNGTWLDDLLRYDNFCSLKKLCIDGCSPNYVGQLVSSLGSISRTLTHFELEQDGGTTLPIGNILATCPNLVFLRLTNLCATDISSLPMTTWPKLTSFTIISNNMITSNEVMAIGKRFPSLKQLQFSPCEDMDSTRIVLDYYPSMNNLSLIEHGAGAGCNIAFNDDGSRREDEAIRRLSINMNNVNHALWGSLVDILRQHHHTLEDINYHADASNMREGIYNIEFVRLKKLYLRNSGWWIPHNAPMLEELGIQCFTADTKRLVSDTAPLPQNLRKLQLDLFPLQYRGTEPFARYLNRYANHAQLKELVIAFASTIDIDNVLGAILHLGQLERLMIRFTVDFIEMADFVDGLIKGCPNLSRLGIRSRNAPSAYSMSILKRLKHLNELEFSIMDMDDDDAFWHAIQTFSQLKCIHIYPSNATNMHRLRCLYQQRPDLKIVAKRW
ncbi:hypothetical protein O0I10_006272 [Lichtheimia ornata]|uniref:F-box domain-containing protein n=1 Tax=Lichtheimia ornata TaxID=688661 RepID=A0AAD7V5I6_9FUNG|nr:uncharacterized protein O0I10_006272 [Lichtheimia ornata]KAJ8658001.1 hypothetical protein O0I10_006272 [Lichtheimia ornata]